MHCLPLLVMVSDLCCFLLAFLSPDISFLHPAIMLLDDSASSPGIAHNKILAKLASGMHKPAAQTLVPLVGIPCLLKDLPVPKLRQLGGKFGASVMDKLGISTVGAQLYSWP